MPFWNEDAKGDLLEVVLLSALKLRQMHTQGSTFPFENVAFALCGQKKCGSYPPGSESLNVRFRKTVAAGVESFPCHYSSISNKKDIVKVMEYCKEKTKQEERRKAAIVIQNHGIIYPTSSGNAGCDIILVVDLVSSDGKSKGCTLVILETKYYDGGTYLDAHVPSAKACMVLECLLDRKKPLDNCNVSHVLFTLCSTKKYGVLYDTSFIRKHSTCSLGKCITRLSAQDISVSLHCVSTAEHWMNLVTPPLYYAIPDIDEGSHHSKLGKGKKQLA